MQGLGFTLTPKPAGVRVNPRCVVGDYGLTRSTWGACLRLERGVVAFEKKVNPAVTDCVRKRAWFLPSTIGEQVC